MEESPQVYMRYMENEVGIFHHLKNLKIPEGFTAREQKIEDKTINVYDNGAFAIVYGMDEKKERSFYWFDKEKSSIISKITPITIANKKAFLINLEEAKEGFELSSISIDETEIKGYQFKEGLEGYILLVVLNEKGEKVEYLYETSEGTMQLYGGFSTVKKEQYNEMMKIIEIQKYVICAISALLLLSIMLVIILVFKQRKGKANETSNQ